MKNAEDRDPVDDEEEYKISYTETKPTEGDSVLLVKGKWLKIMEGGLKTIEIRKYNTTKKSFFLMESSVRRGEPRRISSHAVVDHVELLTAERWDDLRSQHRVSGPLPYEITFAWFVTVKVLSQPFPFTPKRGCVRFATV